MIDIKKTHYYFICVHYLNSQFVLTEKYLSNREMKIIFLWKVDVMKKIQVEQQYYRKGLTLISPLVNFCRVI